MSQAPQPTPPPIRPRYELLVPVEPGPEYALLECIADDFTCPNTAKILDSVDKSDAELTAQFNQLGWSIKPTLCPDHVANQRQIN